MPDKKLRLALISDFNTDILRAFLESGADGPAWQVTSAPFGQVMPSLINDNDDLWSFSKEAALVWTQPQAVIPSFGDVLSFKSFDLEKLLAEVGLFAKALKAVSSRVPVVLVPTWQIPSWQRGRGVFDLKPGQGVRDVLSRMNLRLADVLAGSKGVILLDPQAWCRDFGPEAFSSKLWYLSKSPFDTRVFKSAAKILKQAVAALRQAPRKLVIVDLDETLWGGIVGDVGWEHLHLGGHDPLGEAFVDFQRSLKDLTRRGVVLGISSKNDERVALEAIENHPAMVLKKEDFMAWRINWQDKAQNIIEIVQELNLGLSAVVFIDDNPAERARVREALPEVLVPEWPENKLLYKQTLLNLDCFDASDLTKEDAKRSQMYAQERERTGALRSIGSVEDWLRNLEVSVAIEELHDGTLARTVQLLNKTNQMNLSTRRLSESELLAWLSEGQRKLWTFSVKDRFGESGLTGILSVEMDYTHVWITDFILSCRVFGRKIEDAMLAQAIKFARASGASRVGAKYLSTPKNKPCLDFLQRSGMVASGIPSVFLWDTKENYPFPGTLKIREEKMKVKQYVV